MFNPSSDIKYLSAYFMSHDLRDPLDAAFCPFIPLKNMQVGAADRRRKHLDQDIIRSRSWYIDIA